jgi:multidrug efflux pump subunit AcrA (membrane-fusion protein)
MSNQDFEAELSNVKAFVRTTNRCLKDLRTNPNGVDHNELEALEAKARSYLENSHDGQTTKSLSNLIDSITVVQRAAQQAQIAQLSAQIAQLSAQLEAQRAQAEAQRAQAEAQHAAQAEAQRTQAEPQRSQAETQRAQFEAQIAQAEAQHAAQMEQKALFQLKISGRYFSSLDNVWTSTLTKFAETPVTLFDRPDSVIDELCNKDMTYYKTTINVTDDMEAVEERSLLQCINSASYRGTHCFDIFGRENCAAHYAHLMPASTNDANKWHLIVPGVLSSKARGMDDKMSMFINGFRQLSKPGDEKLNRTPISGIKHFPTNKIRLENHDTYFDSIHCVLIVPILSVQEIKEWDGCGYDAIVLAADISDRQKAASVYIGIGAASEADAERPDSEILATDADVDKCRESLEQLIHVLAKSVVDHPIIDVELPPDNDDAGNDKRSPIDGNDTLKTLTDEQSCVPTPRNVSPSLDRQRVRKIRFVGNGKKQGNDENLPFAPDPMLLLAKAASNWLRSHNLHILPVTVAVSETCSEATSMCSYNCNETNHKCGQSNVPILSLRCFEYVDKAPPVSEIEFIVDTEQTVSIESDYSE